MDGMSTPRLVQMPLATDPRGFFSVIWESSSARDGHALSTLFQKVDGLYHSFNERCFTLRGFHFQRHPCEQAKIVQCIAGKLLDIAVDIRVGSPTFGKSWSYELCANTHEVLFIPKGFAHAFLTLEPNTLLGYAIEGAYRPDMALAMAWNDPELEINWPCAEPVLSDKDQAASSFSQIKQLLSE